jgi:hypothetical protein
LEEIRKQLVVRPLFIRHERFDVENNSGAQFARVCSSPTKLHGVRCDMAERCNARILDAIQDAIQDEMQDSVRCTLDREESLC